MTPIAQIKTLFYGFGSTWISFNKWSCSEASTNFLKLFTAFINSIVGYASRTFWGFEQMKRYAMRTLPERPTFG